ncbi:MAG: hypothetical protein ACXVHX_22265 [Solirubrobacteraceae bacterium]
MKCRIEDGLPVAEVNVVNTTDKAAAFMVGVQFLTGSTVLGAGAEATAKLQPGQNQTIRMGNMEGDATSVDKCTVTDVEPESE